jgi:hypothetical protein
MAVVLDTSIDAPFLCVGYFVHCYQVGYSAQFLLPPFSSVVLRFVAWSAAHPNQLLWLKWILRDVALVSSQGQTGNTLQFRRSGPQSPFPEFKHFRPSIRCQSRLTGFRHVAIGDRDYEGSRETTGRRSEFNKNIY